MKFVSARYVSMPYTGQTVILAMGDNGVEYTVPDMHSDVKPWPQYLEAGGDITPEEPPAIVVPDRLSARRFKMQLEIQGLTAGVEQWVTQQDSLVQIAWNNSAEFVRTDEMLQQGFTDFGFDSAYIDQFFIDGAKL